MRERRLHVAVLLTCDPVGCPPSRRSVLHVGTRPPFGALGEMMRDTWTKIDFPRPALGLVFTAVPAEAFAHFKAD